MLMQFFIFFAKINCIFLKSAWTKGYFYFMVSKLVLTLFTDYKVVFCCLSQIVQYASCQFFLSPLPPPPKKNEKLLRWQKQCQFRFCAQCTNFYDSNKGCIQKSMHYSKGIDIVKLTTRNV